MADGKKDKKRKNLNAYCTDLTARAREGKLDPVIGRSEEIRRTIRIREGDPLEIFVEDGAVIFKKYQTMGNLETQCNVLCDTFQKMSSACAVFDYDGELFASNSQFRFAFAANMPKLPEDLIGCHEILERNHMIFMPIIADGEMLGTLAVETDNREMVQFAARNLVEQSKN